MAAGGGFTASGEDEILHRRQGVIERLKGLLQPLNHRLTECLITGHSEFTTDIEQVVLDLTEQRLLPVILSQCRTQQADPGVKLIGFTDALDTDVILITA